MVSIAALICKITGPLAPCLCPCTSFPVCRLRQQPLILYFFFIFVWRITFVYVEDAQLLVKEFVLKEKILIKIIPSSASLLSRLFFLLSFFPVITSVFCIQRKPWESAHVPAEPENSYSFSPLLDTYQSILCNSFAFGLCPHFNIL